MVEAKSSTDLVVRYHLHFWTIVLLQEQSSAELIPMHILYPIRGMMHHFLVCEGAANNCFFFPILKRR